MFSYNTLIAIHLIHVLHWSKRPLTISEFKYEDWFYDLGNSAGVLASSYSKDNNGAGASEPGKQASLSTLATSPDTTRAAGTPPSTDNTVNNCTVSTVDDASILIAKSVY